jgi:sugar phosphate isomerase/epimerase
MSRDINRRSFIRTAGAVGAGIGLAGLGGSPLLAAELPKGAPNAEKLGWRLGMQAWTFHTSTFYDSIDNTASLGLHYIEAIPNQKLSKDQPAGTFGPGMSADVRKIVKQKLADSGVKLVNYGVVPLPKDIAESRKVFDFAKDMGIETLVSEPEEDAFDTLDKLCEEYGINVAIHNHPKPSHYWNPETVLKVCKGRSKRIGSCSDTGHWMRSGLNPIECLKMLKGRIISFHFKDLNQPGPDAHDVPWGTGVCDVKGMLTEIRRQGIKAVFSIEYEYNWDNSLPDIAKCVAYFDKVAVELAAWDTNWPTRHKRRLLPDLKR